MAGHRDFIVQLENFRHEAGAIARYVYADMAVQHAASKSQKLLSRLNRTPEFWLVHAAACQGAAYVALGRVFDTKSRFNIDRLMDSFDANQAVFSRPALAARKRDGQSGDPPWLADYLDRAYYPKPSDARYLRDRVSHYREIYDRAIKPARHKYLAHREHVDHARVQGLFARGTVRELWRMVTFLVAFHEALWQLLHNGRKPTVRTARYSVKSIYDSESQSSSPHEYITRQTKKLMELIKDATPNYQLERAGKRRGPRLPAVKRSVAGRSTKR